MCGTVRVGVATAEELPRVFALRTEVFVGEQGVAPEIERDEEDPRALHIIAQDGDITVGCARVLLSEEGAHFGRLAVKRTHRGRGIGSAVCRFIIDYCRRSGYRTVWLHAQYHAVGFYERLGFTTEGEPFTEAGILHVRMRITAEQETR